MRYFYFKAEYQGPEYTYESKLEVVARSINSAFPKAARLAVKDLPKGHEIVSLTFRSAS